MLQTYEIQAKLVREMKCQGRDGVQARVIVGIFAREASRLKLKLVLRTRASHRDLAFLSPKSWVLPFRSRFPFRSVADWQRCSDEKLQGVYLV
jgi:hypothetical protein